MFQVKILSGKQAGTVWVARRFPVRIGRAATSHLQLQENGVWDEHLRIACDRRAGFVLQTQPGAIASVNGQLTAQMTLHNGDLIQIGAVDLQFWLADARQRALSWREVLTWTLIVGVCVVQIALLYWLLQ